MMMERKAHEVRLTQFEGARVAAFEHRGDPALLPESLGKFIAWRKEHRLPPSKHATFNILYDDPADVEPAAFRLDLCVATNSDSLPLASSMAWKTLPKGQCALLRHVGSDENLGDSIRWLYAQWLPSSGTTPRDFPLFVRRERFFPDVPEHQAVTDIYLPLCET